MTFTHGLAKEVASRGITVTALAPACWTIWRAIAGYLFISP